jgi:hypothetical protein
MGDWKELVKFVKWAHENYPAKHYFIATWNHGSGWNRKKLTPNGISFDDHSGHHISTKELGLAMDEAAKIIGHKVDILGNDACLLGMIEIATELADSVDYFVGSEEVAPLVAHGTFRTSVSQYALSVTCSFASTWKLSGGSDFTSAPRTA